MEVNSNQNCLVTYILHNIYVFHRRNKCNTGLEQQRVNNDKMLIFE